MCPLPPLDPTRFLFTLQSSQLGETPRRMQASSGGQTKGSWHFTPVPERASGGYHTPIFWINILMNMSICRHAITVIIIRRDQDHHRPAIRLHFRTRETTHLHILISMHRPRENPARCHQRRGASSQLHMDMDPRPLTLTCLYHAVLQCHKRLFLAEALSHPHHQHRG
jgi:hypothetical protein